MLLNLKKTPQGFIPCDEATTKAFNKVKDGYDIFAEYKPRRNMKFHKKYFALLNAVVIHQDHYKTVDNLHEAIKFKAGYYETIIPLEREAFLKTKSISFHSMNNQEFEEFYSVALDECIKLVSEESVNEIIKFL